MPAGALGNGLAGQYGGIPLPVDRRIGPEILRYNWDNRQDNANPGHAKSGTVPIPGNCGFWAYCHMKGEPCVWCGGKNGLSPGNPYAGDFSKAGEDLCPSFQGFGHSHAGTAWFGCCKDPSGVAKMIAFLDCCGSHMQKCNGHWLREGEECKNWPEAKSWCITGLPTGYLGWSSRPVYETEHYYCTVAIDMQQDQSCN